MSVIVPDVAVVPVPVTSVRASSTAPSSMKMCLATIVMLPPSPPFQLVSRRWPRTLTVPASSLMFRPGKTRSSVTSSTSSKLCVMSRNVFRFLSS